jgi:hypothetical protein
MKGGRLWTAHNIGVNNTGVAGASNNRNAVRWYELQNVVSPGTPSVLQSGTLFDPSLPNDANQINMWIPGIAASGQGHAAVGYSRAGTNARIDAVTAGRLSGDTLGTMRTPITFTTSSTAYNPPSDTGSANGSRRWGDYSITSVDPNDNMTMWTIQEYCNGTNTYGVRIAQLIAPPPATPISASPSTVPNNQTSVNVIITGSSVGGSGFYDPGVGFTRRISATVAGGVIVNSVTYTDPTHVTLNLKTTAATPNGGVPRMVRIINPDGQFAEAAILALTTPTALEVGLASIEPAGTTSWILLGGVVMLAVGALVLLTRARRRTGA